MIDLLTMERGFSNAFDTAPMTMPAGKYSGRGIVMCVGGTTLFPSAYVNLHMLRNVLKCALPIEVWYLGDKDLGPNMRALLAAKVSGITFCPAPPVAGGWQLKPHAMLNSAFQEVLLLDADNTPVVDPTVIFDWPKYRETGAVFWPMGDTVAFDSDLQVVCGVNGEKREGLDSGQVLVDKSKCIRELWLTDWLNQNSDFFYQHVYGDKDTFALAWTACKKPFTLAPSPVVFSQIYYHFTLDNQSLFQHRVMGKFDLANIPRKTAPRFKNGTECIAALNALKSAWPDWTKGVS